MHFEFQVRRPLDGKTGTLYESNTPRHFRLGWPTLEISDSPSFHSPEQFPLHECSFFPFPSGDRVVQGSQGFCIKVKNNRSGAVHEWLATVRTRTRAIHVLFARTQGPELLFRHADFCPHACRARRLGESGAFCCESTPCTTT